ncbi:iron uptake protein [Coralloluteibacterium stylophorae]|uniref:Iron uptake protein n=1 Tax=Coralloluteibacterium stylophorae TaxID=1776034 RepID=A0A8J7VTH7_9GAMM|nr:iron uptake protein [Coralloluteibacterium stylophorae]MBS7455999.1 iron uptake protein [Coralloluteibacterium stylophorae]
MSHAATLSAPPRSPRLRTATRIGAAVFGGYAFTWGLVAAGAALLFKAGMDFHDAEFLASANGLLAFLGVFLWTFATRRPGLVGLALVGTGALLAGAASLVQASIV